MSFNNKTYISLINVKNIFLLNYILMVIVFIYLLHW